LQRITASSQHLLQLIDSILTFSRLEAGREVVQRDTVDLCALVRETAMLVEPMAAAKDLTFHVDVPEN
jgi:two-component system capsular synthesis sensor histidine kinase RcsC